MENYGKEKLVATAMCPGISLRLLEITIVTAGEEKLTREVIVMTDFPVTVIERLFTVVAHGGVGVV